MSLNPDVPSVETHVPHAETEVATTTSEPAKTANLLQTLTETQEAMVELLGQKNLREHAPEIASVEEALAAFDKPKVAQDMTYHSLDKTTKVIDRTITKLCKDFAKDFESYGMPTQLNKISAQDGFFFVTAATMIELSARSNAIAYILTSITRASHDPEYVFSPELDEIEGLLDKEGNDVFDWCIQRLTKLMLDTKTAMHMLFQRSGNNPEAKAKLISRYLSYNADPAFERAKSFTRKIDERLGNRFGNQGRGHDVNNTRFERGRGRGGRGRGRGNDTPGAAAQPPGGDRRN